MKAVNLATRPFVNRRPVIRVATLVWVLAIALSAINLWRYGDFFRTVAAHRSTLADIETEINLTEEQNGTLGRKIEGLKLDENNSTARYLNGLIHQRVFPWSRLFDDIEDVLPKDVYMTGLAPQIQKVENTPRRAATTRSTAARNTRTNPTRKAAPKPSPEKEKDLDRVAMTISGYSRSDDAMLELVDRLYASPTFLDPELSFERRDARTGLVSFSIKVTYLTRARPAEPAPGDALADAAGVAGAEGEVGAAGPDGLATANVAGAGPGAGGPAGQVAPGAPGAAPELYGQPGFVPPGAPAAGARPASRPGFEPENVAGAAPGAPGTGAAPAGRNRAGSATGQNGQNGQNVVQPGFQGGVFVPGAVPTQPAPGAAPNPGGVVVPPRRTPGGLLPAPSASPRGGG